MTGTRRWVPAAVSLCAVFGFAAPAQAQTGEAARASGPIEEVVVTARYREESVQDSPTSVTAFNQVLLDKITAQDLRDVGPITPNVRIQPVTTFPNSAAVQIRGLGSQNIESTNEMRAGISINGVFISRPIATLIDFFDVESVQVLRGPQGTTFGKNSLVGGIAVDTIKPDGTLDYKAEVTVGNYGREDLRGAIQFPIIEDQLSMRISALLQNYDGHFKNRVNNERLNGEDLDTVRATLRWTPTDTFEATLIGHWLKERSQAPGGDDASDPNQLINIFFAGPPFFWTGEPDDGPYTVGRDALDFHNTDQKSLTAIVNWEIGEYTLTSITGYIETDDWIASDFDQTELPFFPTFRDQVHDQFSQEIRLQSNYAGRDGFLGNLEWVVGLYYFEQEHELVQSFPTLGAPSSADYATQDGDSRAIFGQAIYALTDDLNMTLGVRHTEEKKTFRRNPGVNFPGVLSPNPINAQDPDSAPSIRDMAALPTPVGGKLDSSNTTYAIGFDYRFTDRIMGYANYSQGFKAGEFSARANSNFTVGPTDDEEADSYEIGVKSEWLDGRLRANVAAFYTNFTDLQFEIFIPSDNITGQETAAQNIGEATNRGIELELIAVPIDGLTLQATLGLLDSEYDEFCADLDGPGAFEPSDCGGEVVELPNGTFLVDKDQTFRKLSRAPTTTAYLSADYEWGVSFGTLFSRASVEYESSFFTDGVLNHPAAKTGDYWLWNLAGGWRSADEQWRVQAWCKNCTDKHYVAGLVPTAQFFNQRFWGLPRTYGLTLSYQR
jgi:iron complex outermembrane recepter protein